MNFAQDYTAKTIRNMKENYIFGSHNTMSYLPVANPLMWLPNIIVARCQSKSFKEQLDKGIRACDIRVSICNGRMRFAHGLVDYKPDSNISVTELLDTILTKMNSRGGYVRLILDRYKDEHDCRRFACMCERLERRFADVHFFGGNRKRDWQSLYTFKGAISDGDVHQHVSSMVADARWYERICPYLYARRTSRELLKDVQLESGINLFDFV